MTGDPLSIWTILSKLNHNLSSIHNSPVELIHGLSRLILIFVPHKSEAARVAGPPVAGDKHVDDLPVLVKQQEEVVGGGTESDVEDEEGVGVSDVRRSGSSEVRHGWRV